jgi:tetratricopeptide (TPR) repeat protein
VDNPAAQLSTIGRIATALAVVGKGLLLQVFPVGQSPDWSFDAIPVAASLLDPRTLGTLAVVAAWIAIGVRWRAPVVLLSAGWYLIALLPTSNLLFPVGTIFGERLLYLPSVGFALLCGAVGEAALRSARARSAFTAAAALAVGILAVATLRYASAWKDEGTLFRLAAAHVPRSAKVHLKLGAILLKEGRFDEARVAGEEAVRICPNYAAAWGSLLSRAYRGLGRRADEEAALLRAVALAPADADALYGLSRIARESGRIDEAVALLRTALSRSPNHGDSLADLAAWHLSRGETELALPLATRAVEFEPGHAAAWYNLGLIHQARGDAAASRAAFARFVEVAGAEYEPEVRAVRAQLATSP